MSQNHSGSTITQPPPAFVTVQEFYAAKAKVEDRITRLEEREQWKDKMWKERLVFVGIIVAVLGVVVGLLVRGH